MKLRQIWQLYDEFGPRIALASVCASSFRRMAPQKHRFILRYLKEKYEGLILKYRVNHGHEAANAQNAPAAIWTVWWQGEDRLPDVVKLCHETIRRHKGKHSFIVLTQKNYQDYVHLPAYILEKVHSRTITITHLSDIIRMCLLFYHGGLWLDSTIFLANPIQEDIFSAEYYTIRHVLDLRSRNVALNRWTGFLQAAQKGNVLCGFVLDLFLAYWKDHEHLIDYFLLDYALELAYEELPQCRQLLNSVPISNIGLHALRDRLNSPWDPAVYAKLAADTSFFKLTWKHKFEKAIRSRETFYGHLTSLYRNEAEERP